jgi:hypothetical protein
MNTKPVLVEAFDDSRDLVVAPMGDFGGGGGSATAMIGEGHMWWEF